MPDDPSSDSASEGSGGAIARLRLPFLLGLLTIALTATCINLGFEVRGQRRDADARDQAVAVAKQQALGLLSINDSNVEDRIEYLLKNSTGDFHTQLSSIRKSFGDVVTSGKVTSRGKVDLAGISEATAEKATVILALSSTVANTDTKKQPEPRAYRISVDLVRSESRWLVSGMEFAP